MHHDGRYGTGDESHLIVYDPNRAGGHGLWQGLNERTQTLFNSGKWGYNPQTGTLVKLKDPSIYEGAVPTDEEKNLRKEKKIFTTKSESTSEKFDAKKHLEDFFGVTRQKNIMKSNTLGEALTQMSPFLNPQNWQSGSVIPTIKANSVDEAFKTLNKSGEVAYGDMFLMEDKDGFKTRHYYEIKGEPADKETQKILKRLEDSLSPDEYETFINRYAHFNQPNLRIDESGEYGTQYRWGLGKDGQGGKGTIYIDVDHQKTTDNLIESIYSEFAHSKQMQRRGLASYAPKSIFDKVKDIVEVGGESIKDLFTTGSADFSITGGPRYSRKDALEFNAHFNTKGPEMGPGEGTGYKGLEGGMLYEDFGHRGNYDHQKEVFSNPIDNENKNEDMKIKTTKKYQKPNLGLNITGPLYDLNGKCYANCAQRSFVPKHNLSVGAKFDFDNSGMSAGGYGGYTLNPNPGRRQEGFKGYLGANYGARLGGVSISDVVNANNNINPTVTPYANAVMTAGYEGEVGSAGSYKNYLAGRRGDPLKWGVGGYASKDILNDGGVTLGGYGHYGKLNVSGGYNTKTGWEGKLGFGIPIR